MATRLRQLFHRTLCIMRLATGVKDGTRLSGVAVLTIPGEISTAVLVRAALRSNQKKIRRPSTKYFNLITFMAAPSTAGALKALKTESKDLTLSSL